MADDDETVVMAPEETSTPVDGEADEEEDMAAMFDLSKVKKKKKKKKVDEEEKLADGAEASAVGSGGREYANYTYQELLDRVVGILQENNPELSEKRRHTMKPPQLMRVGTKKTLWVNFQEICKMMRRNPEHVFQFFMAELGTEGSIDGTQRLVIRGKYVPKYIESLLRKYIVEYVTCQMCRSPNTTLTRDSVSRLHFNHCQDCGSSRSVAPIRAGFHAQTRADRRALRK
ncbi:domain found in IF2B/IF5-domain-containing protein [Pelagophyceae sp. CCMP2097]|nr:domain found in IF2B/IF5-domain-containing protein [Pelagophyceae sp. CCMP2097]